MSQQLDQSHILDLVVSSGFADFDTLIQVPLINKAHHKVIIEKPESICYWQCLCIAAQMKYGLYSRCLHETLGINAKKYFFDELWVARSKFLAVPESSSASTADAAFKIKTSVRLRPGDRESKNMQLPLHQFLQVKRRQQKEAQQENADSARKPLVGEQDPEEFLDPFLGTLMKEPVLLPTSGVIVDKVVALSFVRNGSKDPFSSKRLTIDMLVPQEELRGRICEWRKKKCDIDVSVTTEEVKELIDESAVDPELLEALLEAEKMEKIARRALIDARESRSGGSADIDSEEGTAGVAEGDENSPPATSSALNAQAGQAIYDGIDELEAAAGLSSHGAYIGGADGAGKWRKGGDAARIVDVSEAKCCVTMHLPTVGIRPFTFSTCHASSTSQERCYNGSARDMVVAALNGFNSSILCYGQTGAGKTFTMIGPDVTVRSEITASSGIVLRACSDLLQARERMGQMGTSVSLFFQFVEIYDEQATDLLTGKAVSIRRDNGEIVGGSQVEVCSLIEASQAINAGQERKRFSGTAMNERSSRSHTALIIHILQTRQDALVRSQLTLVDLAGSERVKKSKVSGRGLIEAVNINRSLLVLGKVISALVEAKGHVPYLESKLTTMLRATFGGNSRTTAIINCRSEDSSGEETLQSLRFGERCGMISNSAKTAASSLQSTVAAIDGALHTVQAQLEQLEARGKCGLDSYKKLHATFVNMQRKRLDLARATGKQQAVV